MSELLNIIENYLVSDENLDKCISGTAPTWMYLKPTSPLVEGNWKYEMSQLSTTVKQRLSKAMVVCDTSQDMFVSMKKPSPMTIGITIAIAISELAEGNLASRFCIMDKDFKFNKFDNDANLAGKIFTMMGYPTTNPKEFDLYTFYKKLLAMLKNASRTTEDSVDVVYIITNKKINMTSLDSDELKSLGQKYTSAGFSMPRVVYWRVQNDGNEITGFVNDKYMTTLYGYNESFFDDILDCKGIGNVNEFINYEMKSELTNDNGQNEFTIV
jgi:hypothetical protein